MLSLDFGAGGVIVLPRDLAWEDQWTASLWQQVQDRTLSGALVIESWHGQAPPITLSSGPNHGWVTTALVQALRTQFEAAEAPLTLTLGQTSYSVVLDRAAGGFQATPLKVRPAEARPDADWWLIVLSFRVVE